MASDIHVPEGWSCRTLEECTVDGNITYGIVQPGQHDDNGIPVIRVNNFQNGHLDLTGVLKVSPEVEKKYSRTRLKGGEVLLTLVGSTGQSIVVPKELSGWNIPRAIAVIRADDSIGADWINLCLQSSTTQHFLDTRANTTVQKTLNLKDVRQIPILIPPVSVKAFIESSVTSLDKKIQLNRQTNQTLEAMAQALFKSWFVDFDPVIDNALAAGHEIPPELQARAEARKSLQARSEQRKASLSGDRSEHESGDILPESIRQLFPNRFVLDAQMGWIPEGWEVKSLGSLVTVKRGGSPRPIKDFIVDDGLPWVKISDATASNSRFISSTKEFIKEEGLKKTVYLKKGDLILSNSATPGLPKFLELDACIHDGWLYFPQKKTLNDLYLYQLFLVIRDNLIMQGNGSVFTNLKTDILKNHTLVVPDEQVLSVYNDLASASHERVRSIEQQTCSLTKLRDTLLPKLISGELRLPESTSAAPQQETAAA